MIIIRARYITSADEVPAFARPSVHRLQFSGTMPRVTGLLAATCTPARTRDTKRERHRMDAHLKASSPSLPPRGFVYRTARRGEDNGPIKRMEGYLGYATRNAFDFFKDDGQGACLGADVRLERLLAPLRRSD